MTEHADSRQRLSPSTAGPLAPSLTRAVSCAGLSDSLTVFRRGFGLRSDRYPSFEGGKVPVFRAAARAVRTTAAPIRGGPVEDQRLTTDATLVIENRLRFLPAALAWARLAASRRACAGRFAARRLCLVPLALLLSGCGAENVARGIDGVVCSPAVIDLGPLDPIETPQLKCSFSIENESGGEIEGLRLHRSCGCIATEALPSVLKSGATHEVKLVLKVPEHPGPLHKDLVLDGGERGRLTLSMIGTVVPNPKLFATPEMIDFGNVPWGETRSRQLRVFRLDRTAVRLKAASCRHAAVAVRQSGSRDPAAVNLEVSFDSTSVRDGKLSAQVVIETGHGRAPTLTIPVTARVGPRHRSSLVDSIFIERLAPNESVTAELFRLGHDPVEVCRSRYGGGDGLDVRVVDLEGRPSVLVKRLPAGNAEGSGVYEGRLVVVLEDPDSPEIEIPVRVLGSDPRNAVQEGASP